MCLCRILLPQTAACVRIPHMCSLAAIYVSAYALICVRIRPPVCVHMRMYALIRGSIAVLVRRSLFKTMDGEIETAYFLGTFHTRDVKVCGLIP